MEPIFSNSCVFSEAVLEEMNKTMMSKAYKIYCTSFMIIFLLASVISFKVRQNVIGVIFIICFLLIFFVFFTKPKIEARKAYANYKKLYGHDVEIRTFFYDDTIVGKNLQSNQSVQVSYSDVTDVYESDNLYVIRLHKNIALTIFKNGFISDDSTEFKEFIKSKCSNAKVNL